MGEAAVRRTQPVMGISYAKGESVNKMTVSVPRILKKKRIHYSLLTMTQISDYDIGGGSLEKRSLLLKQYRGTDMPIFLKFEGKSVFLPQGNLYKKLLSRVESLADLEKLFDIDRQSDMHGRPVINAELYNGEQAELLIAKFYEMTGWRKNKTGAVADRVNQKTNS